MIQVTVHRRFADGSPSMSVSPRREFKTREAAAKAAMRLLGEETQQPGYERVGEYVVTYRWDTGHVRRDYYRANADALPDYVRSEVDEGRAKAIPP